MYVRDLPLLLFAGVVVGWLLGGLTGFARRDLRDETLTLLDAVECAGPGGGAGSSATIRARRPACWPV